jgi:hypothetical protein
LVVDYVMQRYFFDLVDSNRSEFDYRGRELTSADKARQHAELIAIDEFTRGDRLGWKVKVSDASGKTYCFVPVNEVPELAAA